MKMTKAQLIAENEALRREIDRLKAHLKKGGPSISLDSFVDVFHAERMNRGVVYLDQVVEKFSDPAILDFVQRIKEEGRLITYSVPLPGGKSRELIRSIYAGVLPPYMKIAR